MSDRTFAFGYKATYCVSGGTVFQALWYFSTLVKLPVWPQISATMVHMRKVMLSMIVKYVEGVFGVGEYIGYHFGACTIKPSIS